MTELLAVRMLLASISATWHVPAKLDAQVDFAHPPGTVQRGRIVGAQDGYIVVDFGRDTLSTLHPTWNVTYREGQ